MSAKLKGNEKNGEASVEVVGYDEPNFYRKPTKKELEACRPCRLCLIIFFVLILVGLLVAAITLIAISDKCNNRLEKYNDDSGDVSYQVYIRSFYDSDGDGYGDVNGLTDKLSYIESLGVKKIILNDLLNGNDFGIDSKIGSMEEFQKFMKACQEKKISVNMQIQPLTVFSNSEWFKSAQNETDSKFNWFIWNKNVTGWLTKNSKTAWFSKGSMYYYSYYDEDQPALNYMNNDVMNMFLGKLNFWLDEGVDGFLMNDVARLVVEVGKGEIDLPATHSALNKIYATVNEKNGELWIIPNTSPSKLKDYYGIVGKREADKIVYSDLASLSSPLNATKLKMQLESFIKQIPEYGHVAWILGGPDYKRIASRFSKEETSTLVLFSLLLPQKILTYYGDELSLQDTNSGSFALMKWDKEGFGNNAWVPDKPSKYERISKFSDLVKIRNKLSSAFINYPKLYLKDSLIGMEYGGKYVAFVNLGDKAIAMDSWDGKTTEGAVVFSTHKNIIDFHISMKTVFTVDPYEVTLIEIKA